MSSINQYCKFKIVSDIKNVLDRCGDLGNFTNTCFVQFLRFDVDALFLLHLVHNIIAREITFDNVGDSVIWFGKKMVLKDVN